EGHEKNCAGNVSYTLALYLMYISVCLVYTSLPFRLLLPSRVGRTTMTLVFGLSLLAAVGGLAVLLVALHQRRFAGMTHGFRFTLMLAVAGAGLLTAWVLGVWGYQASQRVVFAQTVEELRHVGSVIEAELHDGIGYALERLQHLAA